MKPAIADQPFLFKPPASQAAAGGAPRDSSRDLACETQREISDIVREIAAVSRSDISAESYFAKLTDGILRAMAAAEGVVIWTRGSELEFTPLARIGPRTDTSIEDDARQTHLCLLEEVYQAGAPVIVPPTPGANSPDVPANPTELPTALVPIDVGATTGNGNSSTGTVIQVFLEDGESVIAQRGYLRFIAQMADLASEFLRSCRLRELTSDQLWTKRVDQWCDELSQMSSPISIAERIADLMVEGFGFDRAAYLRPSTNGRASYRVVAVSHVDQLDPKSDAVKWLIEQARQHLAAGDNDPVWVQANSDALGDESDGPHTRAASHLSVDAVLPMASIAKRSVDALLLLRSGDSQGDVHLRPHVERFTKASNVVMRNADMLASMSSRRFLGRSPVDSRPQSSARRWLSRCAIAVAVSLIAFMPVSMNMSADATLRPSGVQRVCAPRHSIVQSVFVQHGDFVRAGDPLLELDDADLNEQLVALYGRRSVLMEKRGVWTETLVDPNRGVGRTHDPVGVREDAQTQRQLTDVELRGINEEIELLEMTKASLRVVADRDGYVDSWSIQGDESQRPVRRGEPLLSVVSDRSGWYADASFTQSRVQHLGPTAEGELISATICPVAHPDLRYQAVVDQVGPTVAAAQSSMPRTSVRFLMMTEGADSTGVGDVAVLREGAPVKVLVNCGRRPLGYVLFQDAIDWVRLNASLYGASS